MSKHTPGPWIVSRGANVKPFSVEAATSTIADIYRAKGHGTCEANARLIAAAPELLAACEEHIKAVDGIVSGMADRKALATLHIRQVVAAIAKATE